jgi:LmbE family N-acetylglucosaminyl deacetylase
MTTTEMPDVRVGADLGTILGIWAHPDDEAYLSAGLMTLARRAGQRVVVVTATAGERGVSEPPRPPRRLARVRRRELRASLAAVGVSEHVFLGYRDGACHRVEPASAVARLGDVFAGVQPDTVVTFGPDGITGHPDHRAVSAWAGAAWREAGRPGRLLHATLTPGFHATWGEVNERIGMWMTDARGPSTPEDELAFALTLDGELLDVKYEALRAQASQTGPLIALLGEETYRRWHSVESFVDGSDTGRPTSARGKEGEMIPELMRLDGWLSRHARPQPLTASESGAAT